MSNKHGSQVKDHGRWQCCHTKHKKFLYRPTRDVSLPSGHASYMRGVHTLSSNIPSAQGSIYFNPANQKHRLQWVWHVFGFSQAQMLLYVPGTWTPMGTVHFSTQMLPGAHTHKDYYYS